MPIFEYVCKDCNKRFEALVRGAQKAECPSCHGRKLEQQLSVFAVAGSSKSSNFGSDFDSGANGACGSCGDPRGPGSCALDDD